MDKSSADAFVFAKASGMLAKSFVGPRAEKIFQASKLSELWNLLFTEEQPLVPEVLLAKKIEEKAKENFVKDYLKLLNYYSKPDSVLVNLLKSFEYSNLRDIVYSLINSENIIPQLVNIGRFNELKIDKWPKIEKITEKTQFAWYNKIPLIAEQGDFDYKLDLQYIQNLWQSVLDLPTKERDIVKDLIQYKIEIDNCVWAIRLKKYYKLNNSEIIKKLFYYKNEASEEDELSKEAIRILDFDLDNYSNWSKWKYKELLNENLERDNWSVDPIWIQESAKVFLAKKAYNSFRRFPFTANVLVSWFFIKEQELNHIRKAVETLRLN